MVKRSREESSWLQTVELTHTSGAESGGVVRGLGVHGEVLINPLYEDEEREEEGEAEEREMAAINDEDWSFPPPPPSTHSSQL